jgi:hypothetical protein
MTGTVEKAIRLYRRQLLGNSKIERRLEDKHRRQEQRGVHPRKNE